MKTIKKVLFTIAIALLAFVSFMNEKEKSTGIDIKNMDISVKASDDFFKQVKGNWIKNTKIPEDQTSPGGFNEFRKKTNADTLTILNNTIAERNFPKVKDAKGNEIDSDQEKAVNYYQTIMDTVARNQQGKAPVMPFLTKVAAIKTKKDVETYITNMAPYGGGGFYSFGVYNDLKNSSAYAGFISGGSLSLSRDYYVDEKVADKLEKYQEFVAKILQEFGDEEATAKQNAATIVAFEKSLAAPMMTEEGQRDTRKRYNPMSIKELTALAPAIDWSAHLKGIGVSDIDRVVVTDPSYFKAMSTIFTERSVADIKLLLRWNTINNSLGYLSTDLETANWAFYSKEMRGAKKQGARDKRAIHNLNGAVGEALVNLYVAQKFPPEAKEKAKEMIDNVLLGFEKGIAGLEFMSEETKEKALDKLHKLTVKIAYLDVWKDYSQLQIKGTENGGSYFENAMNITKWNYYKNMAKLGQAVDRTAWGMSPQTVNTYFNRVHH
jgi:putative endopeptidase